MREVVIAGYLRTAQSRARPKDPAKDWLSGLRGDELLAAVGAWPPLSKGRTIQMGTRSHRRFRW